MTPEQFDAIQKLIRGKPDSAATVAARLVLVEGKTLQQASTASGASNSGTWNAVRRYEDAYELITTHFGPGATPPTDD